MKFDTNGLGQDQTCCYIHIWSKYLKDFCSKCSQAMALKLDMQLRYSMVDRKQEMLQYVTNAPEGPL